LSTLAVRPPWLTIAGGSQRYIDAIINGYPAGKLHIHTSCEVANIMRPSAAGDTGVSLSWIDSKSGRIEGDVFHHAILASHGDDVLPLLAKQPVQNNIISSTESAIKSSSHSQHVSQEEFDVFSAFQTTENVCYLHSDLSLMPRRRATWTAWNYLTHSAPSKLSHPAGVSLTYCMNILQHLSESKLGPVLVTMNPRHAPDPALTQGKFIYRHPLYTVEAVRAQKRLDALQNTRGVSYCGAWTKYGFHEDGFSSGLKVAIDHLGAELPFRFVDSTYSRGHKPELGWKDYVVRVMLMIAMLWFPIIEFFLGLPVVRTVVPVIEAVGSRVLDVADSVGLLKDPVVKMKVG
jgi:predicted NAD/FAD-binding protein